jgi:hypothetical protein
VLGWGGTVAGAGVVAVVVAVAVAVAVTVAVAVAVAVALAVAAAVTVAVAVAVAIGLDVLGEATTAGTLRCLVGVVGGVGRYEATSGVSSCGNVETVWAEERPNEVGGVE